MKLGGSGYLENERTLPFAVCRILCVLESSVSSIYIQYFLKNIFVRLILFDKLRFIFLMIVCVTLP